MEKQNNRKEQMLFNKEQGMHEYTSEETYNEFYLKLKDSINEAKLDYAKQKGLVKTEFADKKELLKTLPIPKNLKNTLIQTAKEMRDNEIMALKNQASGKVYDAYTDFASNVGVDITNYLSREDFDAFTKKDELVCACKTISETVVNAINYAARSAKTLGKSFVIKPVTKAKDFTKSELSDLKDVTTGTITRINDKIKECNKDLCKLAKDAENGFCKMGLAIKDGFITFAHKCKDIAYAPVNLGTKLAHKFADFIKEKKIKLYSAKVKANCNKIVKINNSLETFKQLDRAYFDFRQSAHGMSHAISRLMSPNTASLAAEPKPYTESRWLMNKTAEIDAKTQNLYEKNAALDVKSLEIQYSMKKTIDEIMAYASTEQAQTISHDETRTML